MTSSAHPDLPVCLELGPRLAGLPARLPEDERAMFENRLQEAVDDLGWTAAVRFEVRAATSSRAARVRVHGRVVPYAPALLDRVRGQAAPVDGDDTVAARSDRSRFPDEWLAGWWRRVEDAGHGDVGPLRDCLWRLVLEVVRANPEAMIDAEGARAYATAAGCAHVGRRLRPELLASVLIELVGLGLSPRRGARLLRAVGAAHDDGLTPSEIVESVFDQLRPPVVEVHGSPDVLPADDAGDAGIELSALSTAVFDRFGVNLPRIDWKPTSRLGQGLLAVKINDRFGPPVRPASASDVYGRIEAEVAARPDRLLATSDVEYSLGLLRDAVPQLVRAVMSWLSVDDLTRVLRGLLAERVAVHDLRGILEHVLRVGRDAPIAERVCGARAAVAAQCWCRWNVDRDGLRAVNWTDPVPDPLDDDACEVVRDALFARGLGDAGALPLITAQAGRAALHRIAAPELPHLDVLAREDLPAHIPVRAEAPQAEVP